MKRTKRYRGRGLAACVLAVVLLVSLSVQGLAYEEEIDPAMLPRYEEMGGEQQRLEAEYGLPYHLWTIEQRYAFAQAYIDVIEALPYYSSIASLPTEEELQQEEAIEVAMRAVVDTYSRDAFHASLKRQDVIAFNAYTTGERLWEIDFFLYRAENDVQAIYHTIIDAVTGELLSVDAGEEGHG